MITLDNLDEWMCGCSHQAVRVLVALSNDFNNYRASLMCFR